MKIILPTETQWLKKRLLENTSSVWNYIDAVLPLVRKTSTNLFCPEFWLLGCSFTLQERQAAMLCCHRRQVFFFSAAQARLQCPGFHQAVFSMSTAMPCPPPMHADPTAYLPPRRLLRNTNREDGLPAGNHSSSSLDLMRGNQLSTWGWPFRMCMLLFF